MLHAELFAVKMDAREPWISRACDQTDHDLCAAALVSPTCHCPCHAAMVGATEGAPAEIGRTPTPSPDDDEHDPGCFSACENPTCWCVCHAVPPFTSGAELGR